MPRSILDHPQAPDLLQDIKYDLVAEAYQFLFETPIILTKMNLIRSSLHMMGLRPTDIPVDKITAMPHVLMKLAFIIS